MTSFMVCILSLFTIPSVGQTNPIELVKSGAYRKVVFADDVAQAIKQFDPAFKPLHEGDFSSDANNLFEDTEPQAPMLATANFNGDKVKDFAVFGKSGNDYVAVLLINEKNKWVIKEIQRFSGTERAIKKSGGLNVYLSLFPAELVKTNAGGLTPRDAIQIEFYRGSTRSFYYNGTNVLEYLGTTP